MTIPAPVAARLTIALPWWLRPMWVVGIFVAATAVYAASVPAEDYRANWGVPKLLEEPSMVPLTLLGVGVLMIGLYFGSSGAQRDRATIDFTERQIEFMRRAVIVTLLLTVIGYVFWVSFAISEGVGTADLQAVVDRQAGAIGDLKERSRPVGGLTTLTQLGPIAVALARLLVAIDRGRRWPYFLVVVLAVGRTVFYAERLALLEVLVPWIVIAAVTTKQHTATRRAFIRTLPLIAVPFTWAVFAASEYNRSWIYYEGRTDQGFLGWSITRMAGYYATSYNNGSLFYQARTEMLPAPLPYFSGWGFWEAPGVTAIIERPLFRAQVGETWWEGILARNASVEFNNLSSFMVTFAELGLLFGLAFWVLVGFALGRVYRRASAGSVVALVALSTLFVGLLELPRLIYWTQGRGIPVLLGLLVLAWRWPSREHRARRHVAWRREVQVESPLPDDVIVEL